jgi:hypothetical protein
LRAAPITRRRSRAQIFLNRLTGVFAPCFGKIPIPLHKLELCRVSDRASRIDGKRGPAPCAGRSPAAAGGSHSSLAGARRSPRLAHASQRYGKKPMSESSRSTPRRRERLRAPSVQWLQRLVMAEPLHAHARDLFASHRRLRSAAIFTGGFGGPCSRDRAARASCVRACSKRIGSRTT